MQQIHLIAIKVPHLVGAQLKTLKKKKKKKKLEKHQLHALPN
jgi:hypothetical protein